MSTLGSLIKILQKNAIDVDDIAYLKWVQDKRDHFIHRLFYEGAWPGDLNASECRVMTRRLLAIQIWLSRAERRIWYIFQRAGLVEVDIVSDGLLITNADLFNEVDE
jgi:hypothetical protein